MEDLPGDELVFKGSADCGTSCGLSPASSNRVDNNLCLIASNCDDIDLMVGGGLIAFLGFLSENNGKRHVRHVHG